MADLSIHPEARVEIDEAVAWYQVRSLAAAVGLSDELDHTFEFIQRFPEMYPRYDTIHRFAVLRRYPYSVVYRLDGGRIRVVAFAHSRRAPAYWRGRE